MSLRIPAFPEILAVARSRGRDSEAPGLWDGLVGDWPMQEGAGSTAYDVSGYGNNGTLTNMAPATDWIATEKGWGLDFDGDSSQYVVANNGFDGTQGVSVVSWTHWDDPPDADRHQIAFEVAYDYNNYILIRVDRNNTTIAAYCRFNSTSAHPGSTGITAVPGQVYQVAATWVPGDCDVYVDGTRVDGSAQAQLPIGDLVLRVATRESYPEYLTGGCCCCSAYNRALTPAEIQQLYFDPYAKYRLRAKVFPAAAAASPVSTTRKVPWHLLHSGAA